MNHIGRDMDGGRNGHVSAPFDRSLLVDFAQGRLTPDQSRRVLDAVEADPEVSRDLELVLLMLREGARGAGGDMVRYDPGRESGPSLRERAPRAIHLLRVAAVLLMMLGGGWLFDASTTSPFAGVAAVEPGDLHLRVRDASTNILRGSRELLYQGDWEECVRRAEWYLAVFPAGDERTEASILRSAGLLMGARTSVLGLHVRYDRAMVDSAMIALRSAHDSARTVFDLEAIEWFTAKGSLMRDDPETARRSLMMIIGRGGARVAEARVLLTFIDPAGR